MTTKPSTALALTKDLTADEVKEKRDLFASVIYIRDVVGRVMPVYDDALKLRLDVFCGEQKKPQEEEIDGKDDTSIHIVAYVDTKGAKHYQRMLEEREKIQKSVLGGRLPVVFQPLQSLEALAKAQGTDYEPSYVPAGSIRLRRVRQTSHLGSFAVMVGKLERLCVLKEYRRYGVGDLLVRRAEQIAAVDFHVPFVVLHAQIKVKEFYKQHDYVVKTDVFMKGSVEYVGMVKRLKDPSAVAKAKAASSSRDSGSDDVDVSGVTLPVSVSTSSKL